MTLIIESSHSSNVRTINYKAADKFRFKVGAGLTLKRLTFNAIDSVIHPDLDSGNCLTSTGTCCTVNVATGVLGGSSSCVWTRIP